MKLHLTIRVKLFLSILLAILASYSLLLVTTVRNINASFEEKISRDLEVNLRFVRYQLFAGANQIKYALLLPANRPKTKEYLLKRNKAELSGILHSIKDIHPFISFADFVDADGKLLSSLSDRKGASSYELEALAKTALDKREPVISCELAMPVLLMNDGSNTAGSLKKSGEPLLVAAVAIPVIDETYRTLGALISGVPVTRDSVIPYRLQEAFGGELHVTFHQNNLRPFAGVEDDLELSPETTEAILSSLARGIVYRGEIFIGDSPFKAVFEPLRTVRGELVGALSVALSGDYFQRMKKESLGGILVSALFGALFSLLIAYLASRYFAVPLKELSRGVQCIEAGNLDYRVAIDSPDEFGALAGSFNRMADSLRDRDKTIRAKTVDLEALNRCLHEMNDLLESKVTERTAELEMEKGRLEAILTSMAEGMVVTDRENRVILFNPAAQRIFGIAPYKMIGRHIDNIDVKEGFHHLVNSIRDIRTGDLLTGGEKDINIDGKKLSVSLSPLLDKSWEFAGVVMSIRDVTREQEVDRMKTEFISTVSHELKTPLTSMKGSLQLILGRENKGSDMERELLRVCLRNTDRLIRLINDILDISKIESGRVDFEMKTDSIEKIVIESIDEISGFAKEHGVRVVQDLDPGLPPVFCNHDRLIQVLTNLLSNSVKFSAAGNPVRVGVHRENGYLVVSVYDQGETIDSRVQEKLFQRFPQLRGSNNGERGGTGLGLAICKEIIDRHHGRIYHRPGKDGGNIFCFTVPVHGEQT